jgi:ribonuclease P protein component
VQRRHRLSRSRDFDAVYRRGRSVSTRHFVLHTFAREDEDGQGPRVGFAVPKTAGNAVARNRIKRQLREIWRTRIETLPAGSDFVLVARPGVAETAQARGFAWLAEQVDEVLGKAQ